jgi:hypothetical protein
MPIQTTTFIFEKENRQQVSHLLHVAPLRLVLFLFIKTFWQIVRSLSLLENKSMVNLSLNIIIIFHLYILQMDGIHDNNYLS